jgi:hypothetical protein
LFYLIEPQTHVCQTSCLEYICLALPQRPRDMEEASAFISAQTPAILAHVFPEATTLRLDACTVDDATAQITLAVRSPQDTAPCPLCTTPAGSCACGDIPF